MKLPLIVLISIFCIACKDSIRNPDSNEIEVGNWQITQAITQIHSYDGTGLLDTTRRVQHVYVKGVPIADIELYVTRTYDSKRNLLSEKTFQVHKKYDELMDENLYRYDAANNLVLEVVKSQNRFDEIFKYKYNEKGQKLEEINIIKQFEVSPPDWNADSALAHMDDKKKLTYDTTWVTNEYDSKGNNIHNIYKNRIGDVKSTLYTIFSNNKKVQSFAINSNGDTLSNTKYAQSGDKITASMYNKTGLLSTRIESFKDGKLIEEISNIKLLNSKNRKTYKYDNKGNLIEEVWYK